MYVSLITLVFNRQTIRMDFGEVDSAISDSYSFFPFSLPTNSFRRWMIHNTPADRRILILIISFSFGALLEGVAGFGTPGAICSSLMVSLGFDPIEALTLTLLFDTTPVAFGALGVPITTLAQVTGLSAKSLSAMVGRQLPVFSLFLPFYAIFIYGGWRSIKTCWPACLVSGFSFALIQCIVRIMVEVSLQPPFIFQCKAWVNVPTRCCFVTDRQTVTPLQTFPGFQPGRSRAP